MSDAVSPSIEVFSPEALKSFSAAVFRHHGVGEEDAEAAADVLAAADLRGVDTHGVARLASYAEMLALGRITPRAELRVVRQTPSTATVDAGNGLGMAMAARANRLAMEKAEAVGSGWVAVTNSHHFGMAGYYPLRALERGMIGWAMTNSAAQQAPLWGAERMLGTNPVAIAFPGWEEPPVVIDLATSAISFGRVEQARRAGTRLPAGTAVDRDGRPTDDPLAMLDGGALLPLGVDRERGAHKGYCIAAMVDLLSAVLPGANWGPFGPAFPVGVAEPRGSVGQGIGHFFGAMRIDGFADPEELGRRVDAWVRALRATRPAPGTPGPLVPGDPERAAEAVRRVEGIPLFPAVVRELEALSARTGIALR